MNKKILWIVVLVVALVAAAVCVVVLLPKQEAEPAGVTNKDYSVAATNYALKKNSISKNEILLTEKTQEIENGAVKVYFRIYAVADGYSSSYFMDMDIAQAQENPGLTLVGVAEASFLKGDPNGLFGLQIRHNM